MAADLPPVTRLVPWLYGVVLVVVAAQLLVLDEPGRTARAAVPILAGSAAYVVARRHLTAELVVRAVVIVSACLGVVALVELLLALPDGLGTPSGFYVVKEQITTPLADHNELAAYILVGLPAAAWLGVRDRRWWPAVVLILLGGAATLSRGGALALLAAAAIAWMLPRGGAERVVLAVAAAATGLLIGLGAWLLDTTPPEDGPATSVSARRDLWGAAVEAIGDEPLLGVGLAGFEERALAVPGPNRHAHNLVLNDLAVLGVIGGLAAVGRWLVAVRGLASVDDAQRAMTLGVLVVLLHAQVDAISLQLGSEVVLGLGLATLPSAAVGREAPPRTVPATGLSQWRFPLVLVVAPARPPPRPRAIGAAHAEPAGS